MLVIPLLIVGALACLMRGRDRSRSDSASSAPLALASGPMGVPVLASGAPSPIAVMGECLRLGQRPPPLVITCAIAEAESMGRSDITERIVRAFVLPVVQAAESAQAAYLQASAPPYPAPPYLAPPGSLTDAVHPMIHAPFQASFQAPFQASPSAYAAPLAYAPQGIYAPPPGAFVPPDSFPAVPSFPPPDFAGAPPAPIPDLAMQHRAPATPSPRSQADDGAGQDAGQGDLAPDRRGRGGEPRTNANTITVSGKSSPIKGVDTASWGSFVDRVSRELPTFTAARHVGRFRQRRDRLRELGIDERTVVDSPEGQLAAFEADMTDAYHHAHASGALDEYVGHAVQVLVDGQPRTIRITRSGMLGVIQAAGLDGAVGWFEDPADRLRFPHTTAAFLRTNGVF